MDDTKLDNLRQSMAGQAQLGPDELRHTASFVKKNAGG
jgi:hypothetical protein